MSVRCICGEKFGSTNVKRRHKKSGECPEKSSMAFKDLPPHLRKDSDLELLDIIGDDLPDGAYMALAEELGVEF